MALGGRQQIPAEPIRRGADHAEVVVDLGEIIVRRTFTASGGGQLVVSNREGARFQSPQSMLDALVGRLSFDPLAFAREKPARQAEILRELVGLDLRCSMRSGPSSTPSARRSPSARLLLRARFEAMPKRDAPASRLLARGLTSAPPHMLVYSDGTAGATCGTSDIICDLRCPVGWLFGCPAVVCAG